MPDKDICAAARPLKDESAEFGAPSEVNDIVADYRSGGPDAIRFNCSGCNGLPAG